ncbi:MAG: hypothetical protein Q7S75_03680 [bacterium]|nr:hypothetical protein [bacterium]
MTSEGGPKDPSRRNFLKGAVASALGFGLAKKGMDALPRADSVTPETGKMPDNEALKDLKDRNTTIELEKSILISFDENDIKQIGTGIIPSRVYALSRKYAEAVAKATLSATGTVGALGTSGYLINERDNQRKAPEIRVPSTVEKIIGKEVDPNIPVNAAVLATVVGAAATAFYTKNVYNQPSMENIQDAEKGVVKWIQDFNLEKKQESSVKEAINVKIGQLNKEETDNTKKLSLRNAN